MSQRGGSPPRPIPSEKRKTSPNSGSGREWNGRGEAGRILSRSPQESRGYPQDRKHGGGRSRSVSPANGVGPRGSQRSPRGTAGDRVAEQERERDAKHLRREQDRRHERDGGPKRSRRDSRDPERRRGSESGREAGEIMDDRLSRGEHKRQKTEHRHRSHSRAENGREGAPSGRLPLPPKGGSPPQLPKIVMPEDVRQAALQAQLRRQALEKAAAEKAALETAAQEKEPGTDTGAARGKHSPIVWAARGSAKNSPAAGGSSKPLTAAQRASEELAAFQRSQAELGYDPDAPAAMKASPSGSESENGEIKGTSTDQAEAAGLTSGQQAEGEEDDEHAPPALSRWDKEYEEDDFANGKVETDDNLAALNSHEKQELELAKEIEAQQDMEAEEEKLSLFQRTRPPINMLNSARSVDCFKRLNTISEGTYGVVHRAQDKATGTICALKKIKMDREKEGFPITSIREINILLNFHHRNLVDVSEVVVGESLNDIFMVMEFMEHDLKGLMDSMPHPFTVAETKNLMQQLLTGMAFLHDNWVLHRDLKTSNILYNNAGQLKICDFGMARQYGSPLRCYTPTVVTQFYRSIELLLGAKKYSTAVDMWSLGCIMAELLTKKPLFPGQNELDQIDKIFKLLGSPNEKVWPGYTQLPHVNKLNLRTQKRTIREVLPAASRYDVNVGFSEAGFDLLEKLLALDPAQRISAEDALQHPWFKELPKPKDDELMPTFPSGKGRRR